MVRLMFESGLRLALGLGLGSRTEICKLRMRGFEIAQRILQIVQIDRSHATVSPRNQCYI